MHNPSHLYLPALPRFYRFPNPILYHMVRLWISQNQLLYLGVFANPMSSSVSSSRWTGHDCSALSLSVFVSGNHSRKILLIFNHDAQNSYHIAIQFCLSIVPEN